MLAQAEELVLRNAENLRWALLRSLDGAFRAAIVSLEERLEEAFVATKGIIEKAITRRNDLSFQVEPEVASLRDTAATLADIHAQLVRLLE
jgi:hypothetical protein